jgi:hypothetical protein
VIRQSLAIVLSAAVCFAASRDRELSEPIGTATASGRFFPDSSEVWGNATLFAGQRIDTVDASSQAVLDSGVRIPVAPHSAARVLRDRLLLFKGAGQLAGSENYERNAGGLSVRAGSGADRLLVSQLPEGRVEVLAMEGRTRVASESGRVLAMIPPGRRMSFGMQAAAAGRITRTGCLLYKENQFIMQDQDTQEVIELSGSNLAQNLGNRVRVTGIASSLKPTVTGATSRLNVDTATLQQTGGCLTAAVNLNARTELPPGVTPPGARPSAAPAPKSTPPASTPTTPPGATAPGKGLSTGAKAAIAAGAAGAGAAAAIALSSGKNSTSS